MCSTFAGWGLVEPLLLESLGKPLNTWLELTAMDLRPKKERLSQPQVLARTRY